MDLFLFLCFERWSSRKLGYLYCTVSGEKSGVGTFFAGYGTRSTRSSRLRVRVWNEGVGNRDSKLRGLQDYSE